MSSTDQTAVIAGRKHIHTHRQAATIVGVLYILAAVTAILGLMFYGPVLNGTIENRTVEHKTKNCRNRRKDIEDSYNGRSLPVGMDVFASCNDCGLVGGTHMLVSSCERQRRVSWYDIRRLCLFGFQVNDREQWHAEITHFP